MSEHSVKTSDDNRKVVSQALWLTLVLYIFKLVLYFNWIIISNQAKYYLPINRENFLQIQYGFYRHATAQKMKFSIKDFFNIYD